MHNICKHINFANCNSLQNFATNIKNIFFFYESHAREHSSIEDGIIHFEMIQIILYFFYSHALQHCCIPEENRHLEMMTIIRCFWSFFGIPYTWSHLHSRRKYQLFKYSHDPVLSVHPVFLESFSFNKKLHLEVNIHKKHVARII